MLHYTAPPRQKRATSLNLECGIGATIQDNISEKALDSSRCRGEILLEPEYVLEKNSVYFTINTNQSY